MLHDNPSIDNLNVNNDKKKCNNNLLRCIQKFSHHQDVHSEMSKLKIFCLEIIIIHFRETS